MNTLWTRSINKIWGSLALVVLATIAFRLGTPRGPTETIAYPFALLLAWLLAWDAVLAPQKSSLIVRGLLYFWLFGITLLTAVALYESFTTRAWSPR